MQGAAEFRLSFDIQYASLTEACGGGYPGGPAEGMIAQLHDRQAVDLGRHTSTGIDEDSPTLYFLLNSLLDAIRSVDLFLYCLIDVHSGDIRMVG